jgi:hypothetical protein
MIYSKQLKKTLACEHLQPEQPEWHVPWRSHHSTNYAIPPPLPVSFSLASKLGKTLVKADSLAFASCGVLGPKKVGGGEVN